MNERQLQDYLTENLKIKWTHHGDDTYLGLFLNGEEISSAFFELF